MAAEQGWGREWRLGHGVGRVQDGDRTSVRTDGGGRELGGRVRRQSQRRRRGCGGRYGASASPPPAVRVRLDGTRWGIRPSSPLPASAVNPLLHPTADAASSTAHRPGPGGERGRGGGGKKKWQWRLPLGPRLVRPPSPRAGCGRHAAAVAGLPFPFLFLPHRRARPVTSAGRGGGEGRGGGRPRRGQRGGWPPLARRGEASPALRGRRVATRGPPVTTGLRVARGAAGAGGCPTVGHRRRRLLPPSPVGVMTLWGPCATQPRDQGTRTGSGRSKKKKKKRVRPVTHGSRALPQGKVRPPPPPPPPLPSTYTK